MSYYLYSAHRFLKIIGGLILASLFLACSASSQKEEHELKVKILHQFELLKEDNHLAYHKTVTDLSGDSPIIEDTLFSSPEHDLSSILINDLDYAYQIYHKNPLYEDFFSFSTINDTLIAKVIPEKEAKIDLHQQKVLWNKDQTQIRYLFSQIKKSNWLYKLNIQIEASFDTMGIYQSHNMYLSNQVQMIGSGIEAKIKGELKRK